MSEDQARSGATDPVTKLKKLRRLNLIATVFFAAQVVVILALARPTTLPVLGSFATDAPGVGEPGSIDLFNLRIDVVVALFLGLAAIDHFAVGSFARGWYEKNIVRGINPARWWEYSISASLMVVLIAMLAGTNNVVALIALFAVNASMILFGLVMERVNLDRDEVDWSPFIYGCVVGAVPWIIIVIQLVLSETSENSIPKFVYIIFVTLFLLFNSFAVNMWLGYRARGRWADPLFVERSYIVLSLVAKTVLAWQVYAGTLGGS
ncbi:MAG: heliorhodopsin HeR [Solirubrobacterales bacterium]